MLSLENIKSHCLKCSEKRDHVLLKMNHSTFKGQGTWSGGMIHKFHCCCCSSSKTDWKVFCRAVIAWQLYRMLFRLEQEDGVSNNRILILIKKPTICDWHLKNSQTSSWTLNYSFIHKWCYVNWSWQTFICNLFEEKFTGRTLKNGFFISRFCFHVFLKVQTTMLHSKIKLRVFAK